ncbi:MAG TPA: hypothetical protein VK890_04690 [Bacteroidia bacterium]|nr:hypothetical protein [Bacteroidia bacterium]
MSKSDISYLKDAGVQKIYLHFFDVSWNETYNKALPVAEIKFETLPTDKFQYVPVVYITTKSLNNTDGDSINKLAEHIFDEVEHIATANNIANKELQFDCDWTDATRGKYFALLSFFHDKFKSTGQLVSATIRLHQIKYADKTGVPPVERGMLMFYNMGNINSVPGYNSIYNDKDADRYVTYVSTYTLPLDVVLPVYSWAIWARNGKVQDIIEKALNKDFADTAMFLSAGNNIFVSRGSFFFRGKYFMKNDTVKTEDVTPDICEDAATNVAKYLKNEPRTVSLFEFDSIYLSTYNKKDLEKIYTLSR